VQKGNRNVTRSFVIKTARVYKLSRDLIVGLNIPGLDEEDRFLGALIARYHTKALPDEFRHRRFGYDRNWTIAALGNTSLPKGLQKDFAEGAKMRFLE
jgi:hypothetical protein